MRTRIPRVFNPFECPHVCGRWSFWSKAQSQRHRRPSKLVTRTHLRCVRETFSILDYYAHSLVDDKHTVPVYLVTCELQQHETCIHPSSSLIHIWGACAKYSLVGGSGFPFLITTPALSRRWQTCQYNFRHVNYNSTRLVSVKPHCYTTKWVALRMPES